MSASEIVSINPATEEVNATFEPTSARNVDRALRRAAAAAQTWRTLPVSARAKNLFAMADALRANRERLARHITQEMGKPLQESRAEVDKSAWCCEFYAEHGPAMLADQPVSTPAKRSYVSYEPLGLVLAVMPWNFPLWQVFRFAPPTLLAGNGIVLKHAPNVPQCALDIADIIDEVCPPGLFTTLLVGTGQVADLIFQSRAQFGRDFHSARSRYSCGRLRLRTGRGIFFQILAQLVRLFRQLRKKLFYIRPVEADMGYA